MNLTLASFLMTDLKCRLLKVEYDPDVYKNNNQSLLFKTFDQTIVKDDLVVVPTNTRHKFTCVKVIEIDITPNFDSSAEVIWVVHKVDASGYDKLKEEDLGLVKKIGEIEMNKKRKELMDAMGLTGNLPKISAIVPTFLELDETVNYPPT